MATLKDYALSPSVTRGFNNVIGFLNGIQSRYPNAISFVAGMPDEEFFRLDEMPDDLRAYVDHLAEGNTTGRQQLINSIGQYNKSGGMINDILALYLQKDEQASVQPGDIVCTVGAQEAFAVIVTTICTTGRDVILTEEPGYIGLSSFARIAGHDVRGVSVTDDGIDLVRLGEKIDEVEEEGRRVKLLYVVPDYQNPTGCCMPVENRLELIRIAERRNFLIIEDSVYNSFVYEGRRLPTLKSLDRWGRVLYVGSFSKLVFPGLRIGLIAAGQQLEDASGKIVPLVNEFEKVKGQITNNTSTISQAILAGVLIREGYSLLKRNGAKLQAYKMKHDAILDALEEHLGANRKDWTEGINWNRPGGGFFVRLRLPFVLAETDLLDCAQNYGVIYCPMRNFYLKDGGEDEIRLTFSHHSPAEIAAGIASLARFLKKKCLTTKKRVYGKQSI